MRKRRLLSLLLTAALIASSLPLTASAADDTVTTDVTAGTDLREGGDGSYVRIYDRNSGAWIHCVDESNKLTTGKTYELGFWARSDSYINAPDPLAHTRVRICCPSSWNASDRIFNPAQLTDEWTFFSKQFESSYTGAVDVLICASGAGNSVGAIDIDGIYVKEVVDGVATGDNLITNDGLYNGTAGWKRNTNNPGKASLKVETAEKFYTATESVACTVDTVLSNGFYTVTGQFRLGDVDYNKITLENQDVVIANENIAALTAVIGDYTASESYNITNEWKDVSFTIPVTKTTSASDIEFVLTDELNGDAMTFDFKNIEIEEAEGYTLDYETSNGSPVKVVDEVLDAAESNEYINFSRLYSNTARATYTDATGTLEAGKEYTFSAWLRKNHTVGNDAQMTARIAINGAELNTPDRFPITEEWTKVTKTFTAASAGAIEIQIWRFWTNADNAPFDIDGISIVDEGGNELVTDYLNMGNWSTSGYSNPLRITKATETLYYHANDTTVNAVSGTLAPGRYIVSGDFRIGEYDYNKVVMADNDYDVTTDNNTASLSVTANGETLASADLLTYNWTNVSFTLDVRTTFDLADLKYTIDGTESFDFKNISYDIVNVFTTAWASSTGDPVLVVNDVLDTVSGNIGTAPTNEYTTIYNMKSATAKATFEATASITAGETYTLSVWLRKHNAVNEPGTAVARIAINGTEVERLTLNENWTKYTRTFTASSTTDTASLTFWRLWNLADVAPYDVDGISITDKDGNEIITGGTWRATGYLSIPFSILQNVVETPYLHSDCPEVYATSGRLEAGIYQITGDFRLGEFDYNKVEFDSTIGDYTADNNAGSLSVVADGVSLKSEEGTTALDLKAIEWTSLKFVLKVGEEGMDVSDIKYIVNGTGSFDFKNVAIIEASKLYLDSWASEDGDPIRAVNEVLNTETGTIGEASHNTYISVKDRTDGQAGPAYSDDSVMLENGKTYKLSFWMKMPEIKDFDGGAAVRIVIDGDAYSNDVISNPGSGSTTPPIILDGSFASVSAMASDEWQKYTIVFTETEDETLFVRFRGGPDGNMYPLDIDGLSVVEVELDGEGGYTVIGNELVKYGEVLGKGKGWHVYTVPGVSMSAALTLAEESPYYSVNAPLSGNTSIVYTGEPITIEPGIYHITGNFRLGSLDLTGKNNTAQLSATATNAPIQLSAINGMTSTAVSTDWTEATFVLETVVPMTLSHINLMLDGAYNLHFTDISIELIERKISLSDVNTGYIMTLLLLKKLYTPAEDTDFTNLLYDSIINARLRHWEYGDQTLEQLTDEEGNTYLAASDLTDNVTGFTYTPGTTLKYGTYRFSGEFRTTNPGEKTNLRINVSGKQGSVIATNEWTKLEFFVELEKDAPLVVKIYGGPILTNTQDFEMRNFRLDDLAENPVAQTLYSVTFDKNVDGWSTGGQGAGTFTWKTEEDGNGYMTVSDREKSSVPACIDVNFKLIPKATYVFSWDARATNPGETSRVRFGIGWTPFTLDAPSDPSVPSMVLINSEEWTHVSATYVATGNETLGMLFMTGPSDGENISFDMDNFKIERIIGVRYEIYPAGDFDNEATARIGWGTGGQGAATITWQQEEDGNGYIKISDRANAGIPLYRDFGFKTEAGKKYKISYDIKTTNENETMTARTSVGWSLITTQHGGAAFTITNEWQHIESYYTAESETIFSLMFRGGTSGLDINDFAIDNLVIEEVE